MVLGRQGLKIDHEQLKKDIAEEVISRLKPFIISRGTEEKVFGVKELAEYIGQKPSWIYAHINEILHTKKGRLLMFKKSAIDRWLDPDYCSVPQDIKLLTKGRMA